MTAKQLLPNQCDVLHSTYGANDCCLCRANSKVIELQEANTQALEKIKELKSINESHRKLNGELRERIKGLEETALTKEEAVKKVFDWFLSRSYPEDDVIEITFSKTELDTFKQTLEELEK